MRGPILFLAAISLLLATGNAFSKPAKAYICHKGRTISVSNRAVSAHLGHGDVKGRCNLLPRAVAIFQCKADIGAIHVSSVSASVGLPASIVIVVGDNCAAVVTNLLNEGYQISNVSIGNDAAGTLQTEYLMSGPAHLP